MKLFFTSIISIISIITLAQAPQKISYQAVARQTSGAVISNAPIGVKFIIRQGSIGGAVSYEEIHNTSTNQFGLFTLFIGGGSPSIGAFNTINWSTGPYFIETLIDPAGGTSYSSIGAQQLMSVPYALFAEKAGNSSPTPTININAPNSITNPTTGVYNISVPSYSAGAGISISSGIIANTATSTTPTININAPNSIANPTTGVYNISVPSYTAGAGISISSGIIANTATSITPTIVAGTNMIINPTGASNSYTVSSPNYSLSTPSNTVLLLSNGINNSTAIIPTQLLSLSGSTLTAGVPTNSVNLAAALPNLWTASGSTLYPTSATNIGIGTTTPNNFLQVANLINFENNGVNTSLGFNAGTGTSPNNFRNTFVGYTAGQAVGTGTASNNCYFGWSSGALGNNVVNNSFFGAGTGANTTGSYNTFIGGYSGTTNTTGGNNLFLGYSSGFNNTSGNNNTFVGAGADLFSTTQYTNAAAIGYNAKVDTNNAIVLGSSGVNVGIGTTKPNSSLHVTNNTGSQIRFGHNNQPALEWYFDVSATSHLGLRNENNGTALNIMDFNTATGYVGIGVISPGYKLSVNGGFGDDLASIYASNSSSNTTVASHGVSGLAQSTHSLSSGIYGNSIYGPSIYGYKSNIQNGIAGRFEIANTGNSADAIFAQTAGIGAAVHAVSGTTVSTSPALALLLEEGHVKSKQVTAPTIVTYSVSGGVTSVTYTLTGGTDVKGSILAVATTTGMINASGYLTLKVTFNKPYTVIPTVVVSPSSDCGTMSYFVNVVTLNSFNLTIKNNTALNINGNPQSFNFNYIVIE